MLVSIIANAITGIGNTITNEIVRHAELFRTVINADAVTQCFAPEGRFLMVKTII
jgi:hypothetical protein